jgi:hypothetical protein
MLQLGATEIKQPARRMHVCIIIFGLMVITNVKDKDIPVTGRGGPYGC